MEDKAKDICRICHPAIAKEENVKEVNSWLFTTLSVYNLIMKILLYSESVVFESYVELIHIEYNHTNSFKLKFK